MNKEYLYNIRGFSSIVEQTAHNGKVLGANPGSPKYWYKNNFILITKN